MSSKKRKSSTKSSAQPANKRPLRSNSSVFAGMTVPKTACKQCGDSTKPISAVDGMCPDCGFQPFMEAQKHGPAAVLALLERGIEKKQELHPLEMALRKVEAKTPEVLNPSAMVKLLEHGAATGDPSVFGSLRAFAAHVTKTPPNTPAKPEPDKAPRKQLATVAARYHYPGSGGHYGPHHPCPVKNCSRCTKPLPKKGDPIQCQYCDIKISEHQDSNFCSCCDECFEDAWCPKCHRADKACKCVNVPYKIELLACHNSNCRHSAGARFPNTKMFFASAHAYCSRRCALDDSATPPKSGECDCDKRLDSDLPHGAKCNARDWISERLGVCSTCGKEITSGQKHATETANFCSDECAKSKDPKPKSTKVLKKGSIPTEDDKELYVCASCGKYIPDGQRLLGDTGIYCSDVCVDKGPPLCVACGDECTDEKVELDGKVYCSQECYDELPICDYCTEKMIDAGYHRGGNEFCDGDCAGFYEEERDKAEKRERNEKEKKKQAEKRERKEKKAKERKEKAMKLAESVVVCKTCDKAFDVKDGKKELGGWFCNSSCADIYHQNEERKEKKTPTFKCVFEVRGGKTCGRLVLDDSPNQVCGAHKKTLFATLHGCWVCDKKFELKDAKKEDGYYFCCDKCVDNHRGTQEKATLPKALMAMRCAGCHTNMIAKTSNAFKSLYCSDKCAAKHGEAKVKVKRTSVPCDFCSTKFVPGDEPGNPDYPDAKLCSDECVEEHKAAMKSQKKKQADIVFTPKLAKGCGKACLESALKTPGQTFMCTNMKYHRVCSTCRALCNYNGTWSCKCSKHD